jgi:metallo-beta-lactamase class B
MQSAPLCAAPRARIPRVHPPVAALLALLAASPGLAACSTYQKDVPAKMQPWNHEVAPFRIVGNAQHAIHYVGTSDMALFLLTTPAGHVLVDSGFAASVPRLRAGIERLGYHFGDIKVLLASHAHLDHVQGHARVRAETGSRVLVSRLDAPAIRSGGQGDPTPLGAWTWPPCPVDEEIEDGHQVSLGGLTLTARLTPGHTRGATTWTTTLTDAAEGRPLRVVFFPSGNVNLGVRLVREPTWPGIADDYARSFGFWQGLPCDVFLGAHAQFFDAHRKQKRLAAGERPNPFIDPEGYRRVVEQQRAAFEALRKDEGG